MLLKAWVIQFLFAYAQLSLITQFMRAYDLFWFTNPATTQPTTQFLYRHHIGNLENQKKFNNRTTSRNWFRTCYKLNSMHELYSKFKRQAKNCKNTWTYVSRIQSTKPQFTTNLEHNVTIIMTKHDSKTTWMKVFTLRFLCCLF